MSETNYVHCHLGYVNYVKFTPNESDPKKDRLNITIGSISGYGENKSNLTYNVTLWDNDARYNAPKIVAGDYNAKTKGSVVSFMGVLEKITTTPKKGEPSTIYTNIQVKIGGFVGGTFTVIGGDKPTETVTETKKSKTKPPVADNDFDEDDSVTELF